MHGKSIDRVLSFLPESERKILRDAQVDADEDQSAEGSYKHAMRDALHNQTPQEAKDWANKYVRNTLKVARCFQKQGQRRDALEALGAAMHILQDSTSPMHQGFQPWDGNDLSLAAAAHGRGENFDPLGGSALDAATQAAWDYFTGAKPMPKDFFSFGYDTPK